MSGVIHSSCDNYIFCYLSVDVDCEGEFDEMKMKVTSVKQMLILLTEADTTCNTTYQGENIIQQVW